MRLAGQILPVPGSISDQGAARVHVVGLCGTGVRGIIPLLIARGCAVSGSDQDGGPVIERFREAGVQCWVGHADTNVAPETDLVLISAAVGPDNPEVRVAEQRSIRVLKYAQCLGYLMGEKQGIAIAGTHGKTTTSAMVSYVLVSSGLDPSFVIGGEHPDLGGGSRSGKGAHFVAEACEFDKSFLNLRPRAAAITNVEEDHLDYFGSLTDIQDAFGEFASLLPREGLLVYNRDDPHSRRLPEATDARSQSFSIESGEGDWWAEDVLFRGEGSSFMLRGPDGVAAGVRLVVPGIHNVRNALACAAISSWAGVPVERIAAALETYRGVRRRFDVLSRDPCTVIDDYAHHPTEVAAVLRSARQAYPDSPLICVFQPHQYSRLRMMMEGFADALQTADHVIVTDVYRARDTELDARTVKAKALAEAVRALGGSCVYAAKFPEVVMSLVGVVQPGSVVMFLGAGNVTDLARTFADVAPQRIGRPIAVRAPVACGLEVAG